MIENQCNYIAITTCNSSSSLLTSFQFSISSANTTSVFTAMEKPTLPLSFISHNCLAELKSQIRENFLKFNSNKFFSLSHNFQSAKQSVSLQLTIAPFGSLGVIVDSTATSRRPHITISIILITLPHSPFQIPPPTPTASDFSCLSHKHNLLRPPHHYTSPARLPLTF